jgi:hypothetical protein
MKLPQHIFALTKNEQRVAILILLALLAGAVASHYRRVGSRVPLPANIETGDTPAATSATDEQSRADD